MNKREKVLLDIQEDVLKGGICVQDWTTFQLENAYISYCNQFWGNLALNLLYYLPMQFLGIKNWKNHMKNDTREIYKTKLNKKEIFTYSSGIITLTVILFFVLRYYNDSNPVFDSTMTILSIFAFILTVKRCIEQWYLWTAVNILGIIMWSRAYLNSSHCLATILMWSTYFVLGLYFLKTWREELRVKH